MANQKMLDRLALSQSSRTHPDSDGFAVEIVRETGAVTFITTHNGNRQPFYYRFDIVNGRILMQRVQYLIFLPSNIDMQHVENSARAKLYFFRKTLKDSQIETKFTQDWEMTIGPDHLRNNVLRVDAWSNTNDWDEFYKNFEDFTGEAGKFSMNFLQDLHKDTRTMFVETPQGEVIYNYGKKGQA
jgi:hypothetical protein